MRACDKKIKKKKKKRKKRKLTFFCLSLYCRIPLVWEIQRLGDPAGYPSQRICYVRYMVQKKFFQYQHIFFCGIDFVFAIAFSF